MTTETGTRLSDGDLERIAEYEAVERVARAMCRADLHPSATD